MPLCLEYGGRQRGTGSTLTGHNHPSVPVVAAAAAEALHSSLLAGYRSADSLYSGWWWWVGVEGEGERGLGGGVGPPVAAEQTKQARRQGPAAQRQTLSPLLLGDA